jgi:hypothetical protein
VATPQTAKRVFPKAKQVIKVTKHVKREKKQTRCNN